MIDIYQKTAKNKCKCEDYVICNYNTIVLSDGCSSSIDSHLGAMLYCELGIDYFDNRGSVPITRNDWENFVTYIKAKSPFNKKDSSYLDSSCLVLFEECQFIKISLCGDGLIFYKKKKCQDPVFMKFEFNSNYPLYPSYFLSDNSFKRWKRIEDNDLTISNYKKDFCFSHDSELFSGIMNKDELEYMGIASDGVFDFKNNKGEIINNDIIFDHITSFKGKGSFLKRKMNHMFKVFGKENIYPNDDFSIGVWVNENTK